MNAPFLEHQRLRRDLNRERRYPVLAAIDFVLTWSIGSSACVLGAYALFRIVLFFLPYVLNWWHLIGM